MSTLLWSLQSVMTSSMTILVSSSREIRTDRSSRTHCRSCRTHVHGFSQSSRMTISVSGIVLGVRRGLRRGANAADGSERRYVDTRARMSIIEVRCMSYCSRRKKERAQGGIPYPHGLHPTHRHKCSQEQTGSRWGEFFPFVFRRAIEGLTDLRKGSRGTLSGWLVYRLQYLGPGRRLANLRTAQQKQENHKETQIARTQNQKRLLWQSFPRRYAVEHGRPDILLPILARRSAAITILRTGILTQSRCAIPYTCHAVCIIPAALVFRE